MGGDAASRGQHLQRNGASVQMEHRCWETVHAHGFAEMNEDTEEAEEAAGADDTAAEVAWNFEIHAWPEKTRTDAGVSGGAAVVAIHNESARQVAAGVAVR